MTIEQSIHLLVELGYPPLWGNICFCTTNIVFRAVMHPKLTKKGMPNGNIYTFKFLVGKECKDKLPKKKRKRKERKDYKASHHWRRQLLLISVD